MRRGLDAEVALAPGMRLHCYDALLDEAGDDYVEKLTRTPRALCVTHPA